LFLKKSATVVVNDRIEIPRITPGITIGAIISRYIRFLSGKFSCSKRNAAQVPIAVDIRETAIASRKDTPKALRFIGSWKKPVFLPVPKNQSNVNPFQGRVGIMELLKARIQVIRSGAKRKKK
jgi:hypothetical protein